MYDRFDADKNNICKFIHTSSKAPLEINPVNFVWERSDVREKENAYSVYSLHIVMLGEGTLFFEGKEYPLIQGDVFITQPSTRYAIRGDLEYAYISFLGLGAPMFLKRIPACPPVHNCEDLVPFWSNAIAKTNSENVDIISRGVLFYSIALLINTEAESDEKSAIVNIEKYVKQNFTDPNLSLDTLSKRFGYNSKYLSRLFLQHTGIKYSDFIANLRINAACALLSEGSLPIKEIAYRCGFRDALYFSRVFKQKMKLSPLDFQKSRPE